MRPGSGLVVFFENGRLGNQLLQYSVLRARFGGQLLLFGFASLRQAAPCERTWFVSSGRGPRRLLLGLLRRVFDTLATMRLLGRAQERRLGEECTFEVRRGLLSGVVVVGPSFFQHAAFEPDFEKGLRLKDEALSEAAAFVAGKASGRTPAFLHVRRGDYLRFPSPEQPAAVSAEWIMAALAQLRAAMPDLVLFVCTDDPAWVRGVLPEGEGIVYCDRGELGDLAVMASCEGGVLSASSFSWCAAFLAHHAMRSKGRAGTFIAPRYWVGHRRGEWYPPGYRFPWIQYL